ncbi:MAG: hypothetical protein A2W28_09545 [Gammaproteobacteria bacterium RBG_16_51_14]|nr:MAG: hypothetical protein A2W28_09545 [Gammaproteobacteria bacterium RBG_16_51_14]
MMPGLLLRIFYSPRKVAGEIRIALRGEIPINLSLTMDVPQIDIYLEVTNLSNLKLELDRMLLDLWFGQPVLQGFILEHYKIPPRSSDTQIFYRSDLTSKQIEQIRPYLTASPPSGNISLSIIACFSSKIGTIEVNQRFERRKV